MEGGEDEEKKDQLPANLVSTAVLRASHRSLSPLRRHSWEPGRNIAPTDMDVEQSSFRLLSSVLFVDLRSFVPSTHDPLFPS